MIPGRLKRRDLPTKKKKKKKPPNRGKTKKKKKWKKVMGGEGNQKEGIFPKGDHLIGKRENRLVGKLLQNERRFRKEGDKLSNKVRIDRATPGNGLNTVDPKRKKPREGVSGLRGKSFESGGGEKDGRSRSQRGATGRKNLSPRLQERHLHCS